MIKLAFTGRADGMSPAQLDTLSGLMMDIRPNTCAHNGGAGADAQFALLVAGMGTGIWQPPDMTPMKRNRALVDWCTHLIGAPPTDFVIKRGSGTWETIKYGWKFGKVTTVINPDGSTTVTRPYAL